MNHIVLAVDTEAATEPTSIAGELAALSGATVLVVHCDELDAFYDTGSWLDDDTEPRTAVGAAVTQLRDRGIRAHGTTVRTRSPEDTAEALVNAGYGPADILVLGLPRMRHFGGIFTGSVAADVAARTTTPLLLVPCL